MSPNNHTKVFLGNSKNPDPVLAGQQAAQMAMDLLPSQESAAWALAFCGGRHNADTVLQGLRSELGNVPVIGGAAAGGISHGLMGYSGYECFLAVFPTPLPAPTIITVDGLDTGELEIGKRLGKQLYQTANDGGTVLILYDSIRSAPPPVLYVGSQLMDGIYLELAKKPLKLIGAGTVGDFQLTESYIFDGQQAKKHAAVAIIFPPAFQSHTTIMHGCMPVSSFLEITKIDGATLYELNGRPALEVLLEMLGQPSNKSAYDNLSLSVTIG